MDEPTVGEACYTSDPVVETTLTEEGMKYKAGDRVHLQVHNKEGTVISTDGTKLHPYYVAMDGSNAPDFYAEEDLERSSLPLMGKEMIDNIIITLHQYANQRAPHAGLPIYNEKDMEIMRERVRAAISPAPPALPERRDKPRIFSDLDKKIAEDAMLFEEKIGYHPVRIPCTTLPWGWRYDSNEMQRQFREHCTAPKKEEATQTA